MKKKRRIIYTLLTIFLLPCLTRESIAQSRPLFGRLCCWIASAMTGGDFNGFALLSGGTLMGWGSEMAAGGDYRQIYQPVTITELGNRAPVR